MAGLEERIRSDLFEMQDLKYRDFHSRLMPTVDKELVIGVRTPALRKYARDLMKNEPEVAAEYLTILPHKYYEENNLHAFLIEQIKDFEQCLKETDKFLTYIDNWATCDSLRPKALTTNKDVLLRKISEWINSEHEYTVRFAIECLMLYYLDEDFDKTYLELVATVKRDEYYVKMMVAWYFATALAKQYDAAVAVLQKGSVEKWTHNKAIQKALESYRIPNSRKEYLKTLKR